jgi:hypothetical protein
MTDLCTIDDVLDRPALIGVAITATMTAQIPGYIEEASALVCGYLGHQFAGTDDDPIPNAARIVAARAVARALTATPVDGNCDSYTNGSTMGPFAHTSTRHVASDVLGGGVWLTRQDKMALDSIGGTYSLQTNVALFDLPWSRCPPPAGRWWLMLPA